MKNIMSQRIIFFPSVCHKEFQKQGTQKGMKYLIWFDLNWVTKVKWVCQPEICKIGHVLDPTTYTEWGSSFVTCVRETSF